MVAMTGITISTILIVVFVQNDIYRKENYIIHCI